MDPDVGVAREHCEVGVGVEDLDVGANGDSTDQTVDQLPHGLTSCSTRAVERGRGLVVRRVGREHGRSREESAQLDEVPLVASTGEQFHRDRVARRQVAGEHSVDGIAYGRSGVAEELDPG